MQLGRDLELPEGTCGGSKPDFFWGGTTRTTIQAEMR